MAFSKLVGEGDEDIDASIEFIRDMMQTQSFIDDGAAMMAEQLGDIDMYNDLMGRVEPDMKQALAASLFIQIENPFAAAATGGISHSKYVEEWNCKGSADKLKDAKAKEMMLTLQMGEFTKDTSKNLVKTNFRRALMVQRRK